MKQIKKERGIPLYLVEFFDYDYDQHILTIQMQSGNKRDFPYVTEEIYNQFKEAMANDASLFTLYTEHTNFSDVKPLDVKDIPTVNKNIHHCGKFLWVLVRKNPYNKDIATLEYYHKEHLYSLKLDEAYKFNTREEALAKANKLDSYSYIPVVIPDNYKSIQLLIEKDILSQIDNYKDDSKNEEE